MNFTSYHKIRNSYNFFQLDYQCDVENIEAMGFYRQGPTFTLRSGGEINGKGFWDHAIIGLYLKNKK